MRIRAIRESILKDPTTTGYTELFPIVISRSRPWRKGFPWLSFSYAGYLVIKKNESRLIAKGMIEEEKIDWIVKPGSVMKCPYKNSLKIQGEDRYTFRYYMTTRFGNTKKNTIDIIDAINGMKFKRIA